VTLTAPFAGPAEGSLSGTQTHSSPRQKSAWPLAGVERPDSN